MKINCLLAAALALVAFAPVASAHLDPVLRLLKHEDPAVRKAAVESLEQEGDPAGLEAVELLVNDRDDGVREAASKAVDTLKTAAPREPRKPVEKKEPPEGEPQDGTFPAPDPEPKKAAREIPDSELAGPFDLKKLIGFKDEDEVTLIVQFGEGDDVYSKYEVSKKALTHVTTRAADGGPKHIGLETAGLSAGEVRDLLVLLDNHGFGSLQEEYPDEKDARDHEFRISLQYRTWVKRVTDLSPAGSKKTPRALKDLEESLRTRLGRLVERE